MNFSTSTTVYSEYIVHIDMNENIVTRTIDNIDIRNRDWKQLPIPGT